MESFTEADRERAIETRSELGQLMDRITVLERGQRVSLRRIRRLPDLTATAIVRAVGKRTMLLIGVGIAIGSALGGAGIEVARRVIAAALPALHVGGP